MAGGYVINDIMDLEVDKINERRNNAVMIFGRKRSIILYIVLNILGLFYGFWLSYNLEIIQLWSVHLISILSLWLYSIFFKTMPIAGNLIIAAFCGLIPIISLLFEFGSLKIQLTPPYFIFSFLALFAFLITLIREMIKDMQDIEGDRQTGMYTLPILFGINASKGVTTLINLLLIALTLTWIYFFMGKDWMSVTYMIVGIFSPILFLNYKLIYARNSSDYHNISIKLKGIMMVGLLYPIIYYSQHL